MASPDLADRDEADTEFQRHRQPDRFADGAAKPQTVSSTRRH